MTCENGGNYSPENNPSKAEVIIVVPSILYPPFMAFDNRPGPKTAHSITVSNLTRYIPQGTYQAFAQKLFSGDRETSVSVFKAAQDSMRRKRPYLPLPQTFSVFPFDNNCGEFPTSRKWQTMLKVLGQVFDPHEVEARIREVLDQEPKNYRLELATGDGSGIYFRTLWQR